VLWANVEGDLTVDASFGTGYSLSLSLTLSACLTQRVGTIDVLHEATRCSTNTINGSRMSLIFDRICTFQ
jgi:hypothetical protein